MCVCAFSLPIISLDGPLFYDCSRYFVYELIEGRINEIFFSSRCSLSLSLVQFSFLHSFFSHTDLDWLWLLLLALCVCDFFHTATISVFINTGRRRMVLLLFDVCLLLNSSYMFWIIIMIATQRFSQSLQIFGSVTLALTPLPPAECVGWTNQTTAFL